MVSAVETALHDWLDRALLPEDGRIPAERILAAELGVSRAELRKALARLEEDGRLLRQVGRGSFLRDRSAPPPLGSGRPIPNDGLASAASPRDVMRARLALEPMLAALAAEDATGEQVVVLLNLASSSGGISGSGPEVADDAFHRSIAEATRNPVLIVAYGHLAEARGGVGWGRLADRLAATRVAAAADHRTIATAIAERDRHAAESALRHHLMVEANTLFGLGA